jgi:hypothetical protein
MITPSVAKLELEALEQRNQLHKTAQELRAKVKAAREKLKISQQARDHLALGSVLASVVGLGLGYGFAGMFTRH